MLAGVAAASNPADLDGNVEIAAPVIYPAPVRSLPEHELNAQRRVRLGEFEPKDFKSTLAGEGRFGGGALVASRVLRAAVLGRQKPFMWRASCQPPVQNQITAPIGNQTDA